jgi:uncharacterized protein YcbX
VLVGRIASLHRFPVKSMGGQRLDAAPVSFQGLGGDRRFAFVREGVRGGFPWLTARQYAPLLSYAACLRDETRGEVDVRTPEGETFAADDPALLQHLHAATGLQLQRLASDRGSFDVAPVSLMALSTVAAIANASGTDAAPGRFRMNLYLDTGDDAGFRESQWVGRVLRVGDHVRLAVTEPDQRCVMVTLPQPGIPGAPSVLRAVAELGGAAAGVYAVPLQPGTIREGDAVRLEPSATAP